MKDPLSDLIIGNVTGAKTIYDISVQQNRCRPKCSGQNWRKITFY